MHAVHARLPVAVPAVETYSPALHTVHGVHELWLVVDVKLLAPHGAHTRLTVGVPAVVT